MKKIILAALLLASAIMAEDKFVNGIYVIDDRASYTWQIVTVNANGGMYNYIITEEDSVKFWRKDGTLLFVGKIVGVNLIEPLKPFSAFKTEGKGRADDLIILFDGYCLDANGMKPVKHATKISACKQTTTRKPPVPDYSL